VGHTGVVAGGLEAVVLAERCVTLRLVLPVGQIAIGRGEPVRPVLAGHAAQVPERLLQTFGEGGEALPTLDGAHVLPAREGEPEVIEQMIERPAADGHREAVGVGEVGEGLLPGRMLLAEDQVPFRSLGGPPLRHPPLERP
jgi:hypothetical protein